MMYQLQRSMAFMLIASPVVETWPAIGQDSRPERVVQLFNGKDLTGLTPWLRDTQDKDPRQVFRVTDGMIHCTGEGFGYLATNKKYRHYRLVVEYKWGQRTDGGKYVRNSGILLHVTGPDGGAGGTWPACIECQLAQGCAGDLIVIRGKDEAGGMIPIQITAETEVSPDGRRHRWRPEGIEKTFPPTRGQLWWSQHDWDFKELLDTHGKEDKESRLGDWTRVEIQSLGNDLEIHVNGHRVNRCIFDGIPYQAGQIALQCEGFEIFFRKFELHLLADNRSVVP